MVLTHTIHKSIETVFDHLTDMQKFVSVHPIIYKIDKKENDEYLVFEKLKILFIPISFTYPAKVTGNRQTNTVSISAVVQNMTHIKMDFILENDNGKTKITETVTFRSPLPVAFFMNGLFKKQHAQLFRNIENAN